MSKKKTLKDFGYSLVETSKLIKADWNYKTDDEKKLKDLIENFKRNGQVENIIIRELAKNKYEVVNGNHRLDALKALGIEMAVVYNKGKINKAEAVRLAIETNETKFPNDNIKLAEAITELSEKYPIEDLVKTMPYSNAELNNLLNIVNFDWEDFNTHKVEDDNEFNKTIKIKVNKDILDRWNELRNKFGNVLGYDNDSKVFEFAVIEALNIPLTSLE